MPPAVLWPYRFDARPMLRASIDSTPEDVTLATTPGVDYYMLCDGSPADLCVLLADALIAHSVGPTLTLNLVDWRLVIEAGDAVQLHWSHANTTLDPQVFGWTAADTAAGFTLTAPNEPGGLWRPGKPPEQDTGDRQLVVGGATTALSGRQRTSHFGRPFPQRDLTFGLIPPERAETQYASSSAPLGAYEAGWLESLSYGRPLRYAPDETDLPTSTAYVLRMPTERRIERDDRFPAQRYVVALDLRRTS